MTDGAPLVDLLARAAFWASAVLVLYTYLGYPLLIALAARMRPAPTAPRVYSTPPLTVIVAARDEEDCIEAKLRNCLAFPLAIMVARRMAYSSLSKAGITPKATTIMI